MDRVMGVYAIRNVINGKVYIGSSVDIRARWRVSLMHLPNLVMQSDEKKHGADAFEADLLEIVPQRSGLLEAEQRWIDYYRDNSPALLYNQQPKARRTRDHNHAYKQ